MIITITMNLGQILMYSSLNMNIMEYVDPFHVIHKILMNFGLNFVLNPFYLLSVSKPFNVVICFIRNKYLYINPYKV